MTDDTSILSMVLRLEHLQCLLRNGQFLICWDDQYFHSRAICMYLSRLAYVLPVLALINTYSKGLHITCTEDTNRVGQD